MGVVHKLFAGRRNADLALDFGAETITLLVEDVDAPQGWSPLASAALESDDFSDQIEALRVLAAKHSTACEVDLWLPADQVLSTYLELKSAQFWNRTNAAKDALCARTGLARGDINVDLTRAPGEVWAICAAEAKVVAEALDYARRWGFAPLMVTTRYADAAFAAPPDLTGLADRRPLIAGAAAAAAAVIALAVIAWPDANKEPISQGPERIAMIPAVALVSPSLPGDDGVGEIRQNEVAIALARPETPQPVLAKQAALTPKGPAFAASILSPAPSYPDFLSVDLSYPRAEVVTPIYANVAYRAPLLGRSTPDVAAIEQFFFDDEPDIGLTSLPILSLGDGFEAVTATPSQLGEFDVAALGPAPRALRTQELLLENEPDLTPEPETPEEPATTDVEDQPAPERDEPLVINATDPREAPQTAEAEEDDTPGPGSVVSAPKPGKRPDSLDMTPGIGAVAAAPSALSRPKSIKPRPKAVARNTSSAKSVRAPSRGKPTGRGLANVATLKGAITLDRASLLGVFGTAKNRRALLRMSDGRMKRVSQGEVIDGWVISRIQATSMRMTRGSEVRNLNLIR